MGGRKKDVQGNVKKILKEYPEARDNRHILLTFYWYLIDGVEFDGIKSFAKTFKTATPSDSITREARRIQNEFGLYQPSEIVKKARSEEQRSYKQL